MVDYLYAIASLGFLFWIVRNAFVWGELLKECDYSIRRILTFVFSSSRGRAIIFSPLSLLKWFVIFCYPVIIFNEAYEPTYHLLIAAIYVTEAIFVLGTIKNRRFLRPERYNPKTVFIVGLTLILTLLLFFFAPIDTYLWLVLVDRLMVFLILLLVAVVGLPEEFYWEYRLLHVVNRKNQEDAETAVLIIGRNDATITKHLLHQVLTPRFTVLMTPDRPDLKAITRTVESNLDSRTQVFLTEFSSLNVQLLRQLSLLIGPRYVLVESLPGKAAVSLRDLSESLSVFRKNRKRLRPQFFLTPESTVALQRSGSRLQREGARTSGKGALLQIEQLIHRPTVTSVAVRYKGNEYSVVTPFVGMHGVHLLLPVVGLLAEFGYKPAEVTRLLKAVRLPQDFLHVSQEHGRYLVNNTFETDPQYLTGFTDYLKQFSAKKILVLDADILAGTLTGREIERIGRILSRDFGYVFLVTSPAARLLRRGIRAGNKRCSVTSGDGKLLSRYLGSPMGKGDVVLFYGPRTALVEQSFSTRKT